MARSIRQGARCPPTHRPSYALLGAVLALLAAAPLFASDSSLPFGMTRSYLNVVPVTADRPAHVGSPFERVGLSLVQFIVPDVDAVRATVLERGGSIHTEPYRLGKSSTIMFVDGPDGILFEFAGPLLARLAD